jgi:hypothetical protein
MSNHEDVLRRTLECCRAWDRDVRLLGNVRQGDMADAIDATLAELATLRSEVGILSAAKAGARYIAERDTLRQRLADIEAGHGMRAHECCDEVIRLRLRLEEAVKKHAVCVSTIDCLQRDLGALEQRLAEVERERDAKVAECCEMSERSLYFMRRGDAAVQRAERAETALRATARNGHYNECLAGQRGYGECSNVCKNVRAALAPVAEQPQPAIPHMLLVLTHKQTTGGCARCGKDWPCPDAPQPAKASTEPPDHV